MLLQPIPPFLSGEQRVFLFPLSHALSLAAALERVQAVGRPELHLTLLAEFHLQTRQLVQRLSEQHLESSVALDRMQELLFAGVKCWCLCVLCSFFSFRHA